MQADGNGVESIMSIRKLPSADTREAIVFCQFWDGHGHIEKLSLCRSYGISYQQGKDFRSECRKSELPPEYKQPKSDSWEDHLDAIRAMDKLIGYHQQTPTEITIDIPTDLPIGITKFADWHLGMFGVDYDSFEKDIEVVVKEPGLYCDIGGDGYQNIIQPSKLGSAHNQIPIAVQRGLFVLTLKRLKEKIKTIRTGNHNYWTTLAEGEDWDGELAKRMKLVYMKHFAKIYWKIGNMVYPELALHKGRFNSAFNLTHSCKQYQRLYFPEARIIVIEHQHIAGVEQYRYNDNECVAIRTGTYAVYDDYAQQNGFFGQHVSNPLVVMFPDHDHIVGFKDMYDGIIYLRAVRGNN